MGEHEALSFSTMQDNPVHDFLEAAPEIAGPPSQPARGQRIVDRDP